MRLHQKGELSILRDLKEKFNPLLKRKDSGIIVGIGDDAAVFTCPNEKILVTTDMMNEGVHFDLSYTSASQLGFKLVSVNVSDIYAMGGKPKFIFLNIALRGDVSDEFFWDFFDGISIANNIYGLKLLGGDISSTINDMSVSATVVGVGQKIIKRSGARIGDKIYLTNSTGDSACGLEILKKLSSRGRNIIKSYGFGIINKEKRQQKWLTLNNTNSKNIKLDFNNAEPLIKRHLMPVVRYSEEINEIGTSMIDVSDGLFIDLLRVCDESGVGARLYLDRIPISKNLKYACKLLNLNPYKLATSGGEDYELLFTAPDGIYPFKDVVSTPANSSSKQLSITCIGEIIPNARVVIALDGTELPLRAEGYQHFGS